MRVHDCQPAHSQHAGLGTGTGMGPSPAAACCEPSWPILSAEQHHSGCRDLHNRRPVHVLSRKHSPGSGSDLVAAQLFPGLYRAQHSTPFSFAPAVCTRLSSRDHVMPLLPLCPELRAAIVMLLAAPTCPPWKLQQAHGILQMLSSTRPLFSVLASTRPSSGAHAWITNTSRGVSIGHSA